MCPRTSSDYTTQMQFSACERYMPFSAVWIFFRPTPRVLRYVVVLMKSANLNHTGRIDVWTKPGTVYFVAGLAAGLILVQEYH